MSDDFVPSIKGIALVPALERLRKLVEVGKLTDDELEAMLPVDRDLIEQRIGPTLWYPVECAERLTRLLREKEGGVGDDYYIRFGRESASESLSARPIQLLLAGARRFGSRAGIPLIKLSKLYFNFGEWSFEGQDLTCFTVRVTGARHLPETSRLTTVGFMQHLVREFTDAEIRIVSERAEPDVVVFRTV